MAKNRRGARVLAMQALCQWDVQRDESAESLHDFVATHAAVTDSIAYAKRLVESYWRQREKIDMLIESSATKWDLPRISPVERNIMRIAVVEMYGDEVPPKAALNEAIEIGAEFGGKNSPKFINGVLDHIYHKIAKDLSEDPC